jgi:hypothetical protein
LITIDNWREALSFWMMFTQGLKIPAHRSIRHEKAIDNFELKVRVPPHRDFSDEPRTWSSKGLCNFQLSSIVYQGTHGTIVPFE